MMHKIRQSMGNRVDRYKLERIVEFDDVFVKARADYKEDETHGKRKGRGTLSKSPITMMASRPEVSASTHKTRHKKPTKLRYLKIKVIEDHSSVSFREAVKKIYRFYPSY